MDTKYVIKHKPQGAAKYQTYGNVTPGDKGPRMGLKVTPELRKLVAETEDGKWINFLLFEDQPRQHHAGDDSGFGDDSGIPF